VDRALVLPVMALPAVQVQTAMGAHPSNSELVAPAVQALEGLAVPAADLVADPEVVPVALPVDPVVAQVVADADAVVEPREHSVRVAPSPRRVSRRGRSVKNMKCAKFQALVA